jgi:hypothetical protein
MNWQKARGKFPTVRGLWTVGVSVSPAMLNIETEFPGEPLVPAFITYSFPWSGDTATPKGAKPTP